MGRPVNANAAKTRAQLLRAATEHFGRDGFHSATTRTIAKDVGVSFATVHHYFGTKESLFAECIEAAFAELLQIGVTIASVLATPPIESRVERAVRHGFRALLSDASRSRFLLRAFVFEDPKLVAAHVSEHRSKLLEGALRLLKGIGNDAVAQDRAVAEDRRVRFIGLGMLMTRFVSASEFERHALGDEAFSHDGPIENYLVEVAVSTLGADVAQLSTLAALLSSLKDTP